MLQRHFIVATSIFGFHRAETLETISRSAGLAVWITASCTCNAHVPSVFISTIIRSDLQCGSLQPLFVRDKRAIRKVHIEFEAINTLFSKQMLKLS